MKNVYSRKKKNKPKPHKKKPTTKKTHNKRKQKRKQPKNPKQLQNLDVREAGSSQHSLRILCMLFECLTTNL